MQRAVPYPLGSCSLGGGGRCRRRRTKAGPVDCWEEKGGEMEEDDGVGLSGFRGLHRHSIAWVDNPPAVLMRQVVTSPLVVITRGGVTRGRPTSLIG